MYKTIAPECDVWSFGVFLMEVFTDGVTPYQELANDEILVRVSSQRFMTIAIIFFAIGNNKPATFLFCESSLWSASCVCFDLQLRCVAGYRRVSNAGAFKHTFSAI
jgi:hypothetical protein